MADSYISLYFVSFLGIIVLFYRYFLGFFLRLLRRDTSVPQGIVKDYSIKPFISVTIPCYNEGSHIYKTIASILKQDWPKDKIEVIVVDDVSTDNTYKWALKAQKDFYPNVRVYRNNENSGKRKSLIFATKKANGEFCISIDSDVLLDKNAFKELISCFTSDNIGAVGGKVGVSNKNENWITQTQEIKYFWGYELFKSTENLFRSVMCLSGCLTAYRKKALIAIEPELINRSMLGLPIKYGEDRFLTHQLVLKGWKTFVNLDAQCWTKSPTTLTGLFAQQLRWRRSNVIDWIYALSTPLMHIKAINPLVLIYYFGLAFYILTYPFIFVYSLISGYSLLFLLIHMVVMTILAVLYKIVQVSRRQSSAKNLFSYMVLGFILIVSYVVITPLALFTLDSSSWETRKKVPLVPPIKGN